MTGDALDWAGLYARIGALVEQNVTLFKRTDDHESRLRAMDDQLHQQGQTLHELSDRVEETGRKIDSLDGKVTDTLTAIRDDFIGQVISMVSDGSTDAAGNEQEAVHA